MCWNDEKDHFLFRFNLAIAILGILAAILVSILKTEFFRKLTVTVVLKTEKVN